LEEPPFARFRGMLVSGGGSGFFKVRDELVEWEMWFWEKCEWLKNQATKRK